MSEESAQHMNEDNYRTKHVPVIIIRNLKPELKKNPLTFYKFINEKNTQHKYHRIPNREFFKVKVSIQRLFNPNEVCKNI